MGDDLELEPRKAFSKRTILFTNIVWNSWCRMKGKKRLIFSWVSCCFHIPCRPYKICSWRDTYTDPDLAIGVLYRHSWNSSWSQNVLQPSDTTACTQYLRGASHPPQRVTTRAAPQFQGAAKHPGTLDPCVGIVMSGNGAVLVELKISGSKDVSGAIQKILHILKVCDQHLLSFP